MAALYVSLYCLSYDILTIIAELTWESASLKCSALAGGTRFDPERPQLIFCFFSIIFGVSHDRRGMYLIDFQFLVLKSAVI